MPNQTPHILMPPLFVLHSSIPSLFNRLVWPAQNASNQTHTHILWDKLVGKPRGMRKLRGVPSSCISLPIQRAHTYLKHTHTPSTNRNAMRSTMVPFKNASDQNKWKRKLGGGWLHARLWWLSGTWLLITTCIHFDYSFSVTRIQSARKVKNRRKQRHNHKHTAGFKLTTARFLLFACDKNQPHVHTLNIRQHQPKFKTHTHIYKTTAILYICAFVYLSTFETDHPPAVGFCRFALRKLLCDFASTLISRNNQQQQAAEPRVYLHKTVGNCQDAALGQRYENSVWDYIYGSVRSLLFDIIKQGMRIDFSWHTI